MHDILTAAAQRGGLYGAISPTVHILSLSHTTLVNLHCSLVTRRSIDPRPCSRPRCRTRCRRTDISPRVWEAAPPVGEFFFMSRSRRTFAALRESRRPPLSAFVSLPPQSASTFPVPLCRKDRKDVGIMHAVHCSVISISRCTGEFRAKCPGSSCSVPPRERLPSAGKRPHTTPRHIRLE